MWEQIILTKYNTTDFYLFDTPYFSTVEDLYYRERFSLSYHPLICLLAYNITGDRTYLDEARYFVQTFDSCLRTSGAFWAYPDTVVDQPVAFADAMIVLAKQKLNEYDNTNYNITGLVDNIISYAKVDNSTDLGWSATWDNPAGLFAGVNRMSPFAFLFGYLTYAGVGNYTDHISRMWHLQEQALYNINDAYNGTYMYGLPSEGYSSAALHYGEVSLYYYALAKAFVPSSISTATLQIRFDNMSSIFWTTNSDPMELTFLSSPIFAIQPAGLTSTSFFNSIANTFYEEYEINSILDFGSNGYFPLLREHMLQICHVFLVLGMFPDYTLSADDPTVRTVPTGYAGNYYYYSTASGYLTDGYGIRLQFGPIYSLGDIWYPDEPHITNNQSTYSNSQWHANSTYSGDTLYITANRLWTKINETITDFVNVRLGWSTPDADRSYRLLCRNGTLFTLWNYTSDTGLANATYVFGDANGLTQLFSGDSTSEFQDEVLFFFSPHNNALYENSIITWYVESAPGGFGLLNFTTNYYSVDQIKYAGFPAYPINGSTASLLTLFTETMNCITNGTDYAPVWQIVELDSALDPYDVLGITPTIDTTPLPLLFLFGMIGLLALFIGPSYGIYKARKGDKISAFIVTVIITSIGFALTVAWLWGR